MDRRDFLLSSAVAGALGALPHLSRAQAAPVADGWRSFELTAEITVLDPGGATRLWVPVPYDTDTGYQRAVRTTWNAPGAAGAAMVSASGYDVRMLAVEWPDAAAPRVLTVTSEFQTRNRRVDLSRPPSAAAPHGPVQASADTSAQMLREYLKPTELLPTDGIVKQTADRIVQGRQGNVAKARAIYDWVVDNTCRTAATRGCGVGDVRYMLTANDLNGKCADINALFVALARASGVPARDAYGVRVADSQFGYGSLGKSGDVTKAQHCRAEFYADGYGWIPVDPADVRKVMLEESPGNLPLAHPKVKAARVMLFGAWEMNWVAYNHGHDVALPGTQYGPVPFLMYPNGETAAGRLDSLDPDTFRYRLTARQTA